MNEKILNKAINILQKEKEEKNYRIKCKDAGICPKCGHSVFWTTETIKTGFLSVKHYYGQKCTNCSWKEMF